MTPDVERLAALTDPLGVLSVYMDASPGRAVGDSPQWEIALRNGLRDVRERLKEALGHEEWTAALARIEALEGDLGALADPAATGRGRALFAALSTDEVHRAVLQEGLPDRVEVGGRAHLLPLLAALERARPTGVVAVSRNAVRAIDRRADGVEEVMSADVEPATGDWRMLSGPAGQNPAAPQSAAPQQDLYDRRLEMHQVAGIESIARRVGELAGERGWEWVLVAGDPKMAQPFAEALPAHGARVVRSERMLEWRTPAELAEALEPELAEARRGRERLMVEEATGRAEAGRSGALGREEVLAALEQGRVDILLLDPERARQASDGSAGPGEEGIVAAALGTSARVTPLEDPQAREALADRDGVAAILRW